MGPQNIGPQNIGPQNIGPQSVNPLEQEINRLAYLNDKLLHKFIATFVGGFWLSYLAEGIVGFILLLFIGIFANSTINLSWGVIIVGLLYHVCTYIWACWTTYPLRNTRIAQISTPTLRQELLHYNSSYWLGKVIIAIMNLAFFLWLAFELRDAFTINLHIFNYEPEILKFIFWITIFIGIISMIAPIANAFERSGLIKKLVRDIDEFYAGYSPHEIQFQH